MQWQIVAGDLDRLLLSGIGMVLHDSPSIGKYQSDVGEPIFMAGGPAAYTVKKSCLQPASNGASLTCAYTAVIQFAYRGYFGSGAGEKCLIRAINLIASDPFFDYLDSHFGGKLYDGSPRDSFQA
jgi:hypothetical protein